MPGDHDQEQGVEVRLGPVVLHVVDGEQAGREADQGDGHEHEQAEAVEGQPEVDGLAEPGGLLEDGAAGDEGPAGDRGVDEQEEQASRWPAGRAGRARETLPTSGRMPATTSGSDDEEEDQRSSSLPCEQADDASQMTSSRPGTRPGSSRNGRCGPSAGCR